MQGEDKGLMPYADGLVVGSVMSRLRPQVDKILISANRNLEAYQHFAPVIGDELPNFQGPLAGVSALLNHCQHDYLLTVPCDTPNIPYDLASLLLSALIKHQRPAACVVLGKQWMPVFSLLEVDRVRTPLTRYLQQGERGVQKWLRAIDCFPLVWGNEGVAFKGFNSPDEYRYIKGLSN